jgi:hypothetical protein
VQLPRLEDMAMSTDVDSSCDRMNRQPGHDDQPRWTALASPGTKLFLLPVVVMVGLVTWEMLSGSIDAASKCAPAPSVTNLAQNMAQLGPPDMPAKAPLETAAEEAPVDGLRISSQSWRRAGFGSNAQVTFTLRNANDYAVRDIEITCSFTRRDGSHLTDRTRTIHDTVNMKSRRTFARVHVGFVNVNADKAKCSLITANRA